MSNKPQTTNKKMGLIVTSYEKVHATKVLIQVGCNWPTALTIPGDAMQPSIVVKNILYTRIF